MSFPRFAPFFPHVYHVLKRIRILSQVATGGVLWKHVVTNTSVSRQGSARIELTKGKLLV